MNKRKLERVAVMLLSIAIMLSSTGIMSSLASNVGESSSAPSSSVSETSTSTEVTTEGGSVVTANVTEEGGALVAGENGDGTVENPYKISNADEFLAMQSKINLTTSSNKNFVLTSDIDFSELSNETLEKRAGYLVTISKALEKESPNIYFNLNGNGHKIKGLNFRTNSLSAMAIFGYINEKSTVSNLVIEKPVITSESESLTHAAVLVAQNKGTVKNVEITYPVMTLKASTYVGFVAAVNEGTISKVTVKSSHTNASGANADNHTISAVGAVGAIAGKNTGTITSASALNIGMFMPANATAKTVYGGLVGVSSGNISNSVSTGNVCGGKSDDVAAGIVGKAMDGLKLSDNYTLVSIQKTISACGVIGIAGTEEMINDCYWSSTVSGRATPVTDFGAGLNDLSTGSFKVLNVGKTLKVTKADVSAVKWGKAVIALDGEFLSKSGNVTANETSTEMTVNGAKPDTVETINYVASIALPTNIGSGAVTLKQYMRVNVFVVPADAKGNGTAESPLEISNSTEFLFLNYNSGMSCKLTEDISVSSAVNLFNGVLDGNGHTIKVQNSLFNNVGGTVKNVNIIVTADSSNAVFPNLIGATMSNILVSQANGVKLNALKGNTGIFANRIADASNIEDCRVKGEIAIGASKLINIGGFAGVVVGKNTSITNSGAAVGISANDESKENSVANFIGSVSADAVKLENCYAAGVNKAGNFMFVGTVDAKSITVSDCYIDYSADKSAASKAMNFNAYEQLVSEKAFKEWTFNGSNTGFFTGNGGQFSAKLPQIKSVQNSSVDDFSLTYDSSKISASLALDGAEISLNVKRLSGVVTVKAMPVTITNIKTGLSTTIYVSNGLEKDANGNYVVSTAYDLTYIGENIDELNSASFVMNSDVDMSVITNYTPIGSTGTVFSGRFNGNGHTVSNLTINGTAKTALFGVLSDAEVKNIKFKNATVNSEGGYAAVLAGQAIGKTVITGITVENGNVNVSDNYAAVIVALAGSDDGVQISDVTVKNSTVKSTAGYVGAVVGRANAATTISDVAVDGFTATGSNYISGAVGLANGEQNVNISNVKVNGAKLSGVSEISGIASGNGNGITIKNAEVNSSDISTLGAQSSFTAGGISAVYGSTIENVKVNSTKIFAGVAGGIVAKTATDCNVSISDASVIGCEISASEANSVAAGILGVHNSKGAASISNSSVDAKTIIRGAAVSAALVGDCSGADSVLKLNNVKTFAAVNGCDCANAISAAGAVGRIGASAINNVALNNVTVGGTLSGAGVLGGVIGLVKSGEPYNGKNAIITNSIAFIQINPFEEKTQTGMIIGGVENKKIITPDDTDKAISNLIISTYYGSVSAYGAESGLTGGGFIDMDKPNGEAIKASVPVLSTAQETNVEISNLPDVKGFTFDAETGWVSESADRIEVVSSTEKSAVLKANHMADLSIVAYYVLDTDSEVRIPVHFNMVSDIRTPLKGEGTEALPYLVSGAYDLETVAQYDSENAYFVLTEDIEFKPEDFEFGGAFYNVGNGVVTIGNVERGFKGTFSGYHNGKTHSITGLAISGNAFGGLFGALDGATIRDIVLNDTEISGLNYAGAVAGSARNAVIKNITINNASIKAEEFGGYAGSVVGYAENTTLENITVNGAQVRTTLDATGATVEIAGGIAGVFSGKMLDVKARKLNIEAGTVAGGVIGAVRDENAEITNTSVNAVVTAEVVGGAVGRLENPLKLRISDFDIGGELDGETVSAGIIGQVSAESDDYSVDKLEAPLISDAVITALISDAQSSGVVVGKASAKVFCDKENVNTEVLRNINYSSYQNGMAAFGDEEINAYQNSEYTINDLSDIKYSANGKLTDYIPLDNEFTTLADNSLLINGVEGSFKSFTVGTKTFTLENITSDVDNAIVYDAEKSAVKLNGVTADEINLVLEYNDGLKLAIKVIPSSQTAEDAVSVTYNIVDVSDGLLSDKLVGILLKSKADGTFKSIDSFTKADESAKQLGPIVVEDGELYVNAVLPQGVKYSVSAVDESGNMLTVTDERNEGSLVSVGEAKSVTITILTEARTESVWGVRSIWGVIGN